MRDLIAAFAALCLPGSAMAELACTFNTECFDGEACQDADFSLEIVDGDPVSIITEFGDFGVISFQDGAWLADGSGMLLLLSVAESGDARASFHLEGPLVTTYLGSCGGEQ